METLQTAGEAGAELTRAFATASRPNRRALAEWALEQLYAAVFSGTLAAGTPLGEIELTKALGVSRSPVREALKQLELDGLLEVSPVNGRRVLAAFNVSDIDGLYTIRAALESLAFRRAAPKITPADLTALWRIQKDMEAREAATSRGGPRDFELDFRFHEFVCLTSGLARLERALRPLWVQTRALLRQLDSVGAYPADVTEVDAAYMDHRRILEALEAQDGDEAGRLVEHHLYARRDALIAGVERRGGLT